jgi:hypothetical protein
VKIYRWDEVQKRIDKNQKLVKIAEIGVWTGKFARRILKNKNVFLDMVDRWCVPPSGDSYLTSGSSMALSEKKIFDDAYNKAVEIHNQYKKRSKILKMDSVEAAHNFPDGEFDIVFVDGDHSDAGCRRDIIAWLPKVKKGGWICGHDYDHPDQGDVKKVVDEIFAGEKIEIGENRTWFVRIK